MDHRLFGSCDRTIAVARFSVLANGVHHFHAVGYISKHGIAAVQKGTVLMDDKELG